MERITMHQNDPHIRHHRRSIRLKGYDYSQNGAYFVTICTQDRRCLFGDIVQGVFVPNPAGKMIRQVWDEAPDHYPIQHGEFVVMPNHIHAIVILSNTIQNTDENIGQPQGNNPTMTLGDVVHRYKTMTTHRYTIGVKTDDWPAFFKRLWQRNYYEHIIRNDDEYHTISDYIINNPKKWDDDKLWNK
jgi:putative transposase